MNIKNEKTDVVHAPYSSGNEHVCLCGAIFHPSWSVNEKITCRNCLRLLKQNKKLCKFPDCVNYSTKATSYCCNGCAGDHFDFDRLATEEEKNDGRRKTLLKEIEDMIKNHKSNLPVKLEKKSLEILEYFIRIHADVHHGAGLNEIITQMLENYCAYLKEYHLN